MDNGLGGQWRTDRSDVSKWMTKTCKAAGLPNIKPFHWGIRATMITELLTAGVDPYAVQKLADHESINTTMLYFNKRKVDQKKASDEIDKALHATKQAKPTV